MITRFHASSRRYILFVVLITTFLLQLLPLHAQEEQEREEAAREAVREQKLFERILPRAVPVKEEKPEVKKEEEAEEPPTPPIRFIVKKITFRGNTLFKSKELHELVQLLENREITLDQLKEGARAITRLYRSKGYVTSFAFIPTQRLSEGTALIEIVEGRIGEITVEGNRWFRKKLILQQSRLREKNILDIFLMEKRLRDINQNRDKRVAAVIERGELPGTTNILLRVQDRFPVHAGTDISNFGTRATGRYRLGLTGRVTNVTSLDDSVNARFQWGKEIFAYGGAYSIPFNNYSSRFTTGYSRVNSNLDKELKGLGFEGKAQVYNFNLTHRFFESRHLDIDLDLGLYHKQVVNFFFAGTIGGATDDELRIFRPSLLFRQEDRWGRTFLNYGTSFGFDRIFGASSKRNRGGTRRDNETQFQTYTIDLNRINRFLFGTTLSHSTELQLTNDTLAPIEQMSIGGNLSVRGYDEGEILADYGVINRTEVRSPLYLIPNTLYIPFTQLRLRDQIEAVGFVDHAIVAIRSLRGSQKEHNLYVGLGGGLRVHLFENLYARLEWAGPVGDEPLLGEEDRFIFSVQAEV